MRSLLILALFVSVSTGACRTASDDENRLLLLSTPLYFELRTRSHLTDAQLLATGVARTVASLADTVRQAGLLYSSTNDTVIQTYRYTFGDYQGTTGIQGLSPSDLSIAPVYANRYWGLTGDGTTRVPTNCRVNTYAEDDSAPEGRVTSENGRLIERLEDYRDTWLRVTQETTATYTFENFPIIFRDEFSAAANGVGNVAWLPYHGSHGFTAATDSARFGYIPVTALGCDEAKYSFSEYLALNHLLTFNGGSITVSHIDVRANRRGFFLTIYEFSETVRVSSNNLVLNGVPTTLDMEYTYSGTMNAEPNFAALSISMSGIINGESINGTFSWP